jgi:hypothetical protein
VTLHDPDLIEIDCRPCALCGLQIDLHRMVDSGEGPEHFCFEAAETVGYLVARKYTSTNGRPFALGFNAGLDFAIRHLVLQEAASMVEAPPIVPADREPAPYRTPRATVDAFKFVVSLANAGHLARWLRDHPRDAPFLLKLLEAQ